MWYLAKSQVGNCDSGSSIWSKLAFGVARGADPVAACVREIMAERSSWLME
jgi:hypothetical protein